MLESSKIIKYDNASGRSRIVVLKNNFHLR
jgi:hypothetical protein